MDSPKDWMREYPHHLEDSVILQATPESLFSFLDDHRNLGAHMSGGKSAMLGMGGMTLKLEDPLRQTSDFDPQASEFLAAAYANTYGREPNYDHAFDLAIKGVEQAAIPRMELSAKYKTLGRVMEQFKKGKFGLNVPMPEEHESAKYSLLADACEVLWRSNEWRHAGKAAKAIPVSKEQAEVATTLATTLVYLISSPGLAGPLGN